MKIYFWGFFKGLHMYNKWTLKILDHLKENTFEFHFLIATHKIFLIEEIWFDKLQPFFYEFLKLLLTSIKCNFE
jgi:hypothetical protein